MATNYVRDSEGRTFIAESQRPDGSVRRQRRVKDGFVPQEEVPLYEPKGKKMNKNDNSNGPSLPPGITPELWEQMKQQQRRGPVPALAAGTGQQQQKAKTTTAVPKVTKAKAKPIRVVIKESNPVAVSSGHHDTIEVDSGVGEPDEWTTVTRKSNRKKNAAGDENAVAVEKISTGVNGISITGDKKKKKKPAKSATGNNNNTAAAAATAAQQSVAAKKSSDGKKQQQQQQQEQETAQEAETEADPAKRLRNLKKRLKEIESLRQKDKNTLGPDQVEKVKRYQDVKKQVAKLESALK